MRFLLITVALCAAAISADAATPEQETELRQLEQVLQPLTIGLSGATTADEVRAALKPTTSALDKACEEDICSERLDFAGGQTVTYTGLLDRNYKPPAKDSPSDAPVTASGWWLWLWLDAKAAPGLCLSVESWNAAFKAAGWPPATPSVMFYTVRVSDNPKVLKDNNADAAKKREIPATIFTSHKDGRRVKLATGPDVLTGVNSSADVAAALAMEDCVRAVSAENW
jgi:hypothetical protein